MYKRPLNPRSKRGFTLTEMMAVAAILAILAGLAIPNLISYQRRLQMQELDNCAQEIFFAAQNRLTARKSSGTVALLSNDSGQAQNVSGVDALAGYNAYYLTEETVGDLLPSGTLEGGVMSGRFYIMYDQDSGSVLAVLYGRDSFDYKEGYRAVGQDVQSRLKQGLWVGWYTGDPAGSESIVQLDAPTPYITNGEKLLAEVIVSTPSATAAPLSSIDFHASINGVELSVGSPVPVGAMSQKYTIVLDSLVPGEPRFRELGTGVTPGEDFTLKVWTTCSSPTVKDSPYGYAADNSLFDSGTKGDTAYIRCGRHLQNLDEDSGVTPSIHHAVQTANLRFDDTGAEDSWYAYYTQNGVAYAPITNVSLASYNGWYAAKLTQTTITGLTASGTDAGMFATFSGTGLSNIWLVNPKLAAAQYAGGLAAHADADALTVDGCRVYHAYTGSTVKSELAASTNYQITGATVGGLVGWAEGELTLRNSLSATLLRGNLIAGGLVGSAGSAVISGSYADCYLAAHQAGGLVGQAARGSTVDTCYSAGFVNEAEIAAGLLCGEASTTVKNSYSAMTYLSGTTQVYPLVKRGTASASFYLTASNTQNAIGTPLGGGALQNQSMDGFSPAGAAARPYNLMDGLGLRNYTFPKLPDLPHYGDWRAEFQSGTLVYYERYEDSYQGRNYGFYGGNLDLLPPDGSAVTPVQDGYAVVFNNSEPPSSVSYVFGDQSGTLTSFFTFPGLDQEGNTVTYRLYPLPDSVVNTQTASAGFYQQITIVVDGSPTLYDFNPHFANTAVARGEASAPPAVEEESILLRTPRHLYALSCFSKEYASNGWAFSQELDLNYGDYHWNAEGFTAPMAGTARIQAPIGPDIGSAGPFTGAYNGNGHLISGVSVSGTGGSIGLFGVNSGTLRGVRYVSPNSSVSRSGSISGRASTVYLGGLAGRNEGNIADCAAASLDLSAGNVKNSTVYMGGLTGFNDGGLIRQSTAACASIQTSSTRANAYAAAFAGRNSGTITRSYGQGAVSAARDTTGTVAAAGFAAENTGTISNSYCATGLYADGGAKEAAFCWSSDAPVSSCYYLTDGSYSFGGRTYGLTYHDGSGAVGLTQVELAAMTKQTKDGDGNIIARAPLSFPGMSLADSSTRIDRDGDGWADEIDDSALCPYPLVLDRHYGPWLQRLDLGDLGVCYWEKEEKPAGDGGVSEAYHFYSVGLDFINTTSQYTKAVSTLCGYHDDGGVITDYGYGYFYRSDSDRVSLSSSLLNTNDASLNSQAQEALEIQLEGQYSFVTYNTYDVSTGRGLYPSASSVNGTWTLSRGGRNYAFTFSPFFAASIQFSGDGKTAVPGTADSNPYGIRSIRQLQFINWNYKNKNCSTESQGKAGSYPYLAYADNQLWGQHYLQSHDLDGGNVSNYTPIGSMSTWFAGSYNGNDYVIRDLSIHSSARLVGLFGLIHGGNVNNVIMYGEKGAVVESTYGTGNYSGVGVLAGAALNDKSVVNNCAVSGYTVLRSGNINSYTSVGGLFGMCNMTLSGCTAVTNINVSSSAYSQKVYLGGLVGSAKCTIAQCYAGGNMTFSGAYSNYLYQGGITGFEDSPSTNHGGPGTPLILRNSYSYCQISKQGASVYAIGPGTVLNCYYLGEAVNGSLTENKAVSLTYQEFSNGTLLSKLNSGTNAFSPVTTRYADGTAIDGKYTFPTRGDLDGRNYPFPTILTQESDRVAGGTAHLHYGDWPEKGLLGDALVEVDLIALRPDGTPDHTASVPLTPTGVSGGGTYQVLEGTEYDPAIARVSLPERGTGTGNTLTVTGLVPGFTTVTVRYTADGRSYDLEIEIAVTAAVNVSVQPPSATLLTGGSAQFLAAAFDKYGSSLAGDRLSWAGVESNALSVADVSAQEETEEKTFAFTALGLSRGSDTQDAIFTVTAQYAHPDTGAVYTGLGRASVSVVPVSITAQPVTLAAGGSPVSYGPESLSVSVQGQTLTDVSITDVRVSNTGLASASLDQDTGRIAFTGLAGGATQAALTLAYSYGGQSYTGSASVPLTVTEPALTLSPASLSIQTGENRYFANAATAAVLYDDSPYTYSIDLIGTPDGSWWQDTYINADTGLITVNVDRKSLGDYTYQVTAKRDGDGYTRTAVFTVSVVEGAFTLEGRTDGTSLYGGQSRELPLVLRDSSGSEVEDWSGYTFSCTSPSGRLSLAVDQKTHSLRLTAGLVPEEFQTTAAVTVQKDGLTAAVLTPVTLYPAPVLTPERDALEVPPIVNPWDSPYTVEMKLTAHEDYNFTLSVDGWDSGVAEAALDYRTLKITPRAAGETTVTVTAVHRDDPEVRVSASVRVTVVEPPRVQLSLSGGTVYVPYGGSVALPLAQAVELPDSISAFQINGVRFTAQSSRVNGSYDGNAVVLSGWTVGNDTLTMTVDYQYTYRLGGTTYKHEESALVTLDATVFQQVDSPSASFGFNWSDYSAYASLSVLSGTDCTVTVGNAPNTSVWSVTSGSDSPSVSTSITGNGNNRKLMVQIKSPIQSGTITVTGKKTYSYALTISLTVYANPDALTLTVSAPESNAAPGGTP